MTESQGTTDSAQARTVHVHDAQGVQVGNGFSQVQRHTPAAVPPAKEAAAAAVVGKHLQRAEQVATCGSRAATGPQSLFVQVLEQALDASGSSRQVVFSRCLATRGFHNLASTYLVIQPGR